MKKDELQKLYTGIVLVLLLVALIIFKDEDKMKIIKKDFEDPLFLGFFFIILALTIWGLSNDNGKIRDTTRHAVIAFLIAYFAHLDMVFAAFFLVAIFVYFTHEEVVT